LNAVERIFIAVLALAEANVREQILKGNRPGKPMPMSPFEGKLSAKDMSNLIDYLKMF
jgi:hypothetical protein